MVLEDHAIGLVHGWFVKLFHIPHFWHSNAEKFLGQVNETLQVFFYRRMIM